MLIAAALVVSVGVCVAEVVEMKNGERFLGKLLSVSTNSVVLESQSAGTLTLARTQVAAIHFENPKATATVATTNSAQKTSLAEVQALSRPGKNLGTQTNLVELVQRDLLSQASPEATQQFQSMVASLMTGRLSVEDLKKQARSVAEEARRMRADLGEEAGIGLDSYLAILDNFLKDRPVLGGGELPSKN